MCFVLFNNWLLCSAVGKIDFSFLDDTKWQRKERRNDGRKNIRWNINATLSKTMSTLCIKWSVVRHALDMQCGKYTKKIDWHPNEVLQVNVVQLTISIILLTTIKLLNRFHAISILRLYFINFATWAVCVCTVQWCTLSFRMFVPIWISFDVKLAFFWHRLQLSILLLTRNLFENVFYRRTDCRSINCNIICGFGKIIICLP